MAGDLAPLHPSHPPCTGPPAAEAPRPSQEPPIMRSHLLAVLAIFLLALAQATAAELTWTGGGGAGMTDWSSPLNWGGATPVAGDALIFPEVPNKNASNGTYAANTAFGPLTI